MRNDYDFSTAKRGALMPAEGKTRITIYLGNTTLAAFRNKAELAGIGYQTLINQVLKSSLIEQSEELLTESVLRRVLREELPSLAK